MCNPGEEDKIEEAREEDIEVDIQEEG